MRLATEEQLEPKCACPTCGHLDNLPLQKATLSALLYVVVKVLGKSNTLTIPKAREVEGSPRHQFSYEIIGDDIVILLEEFDET